MNDGRRYLGPRRQQPGRAPGDRRAHIALDGSGTVATDPGRRPGTTEAADRAGNVVIGPLLPNPAAANAFLEARARARQRAEREDASLDSLQYLRANDVCRLLRISKPTLWRLRRKHGFPEPTEVTDRVIAWRRSEVEGWLRERDRNGRAVSGRPSPKSAPVSARERLAKFETSDSRVIAVTLPTKNPRKRIRPKPPDEQLSLALTEPN